MGKLQEMSDLKIALNDLSSLLTKGPAVPTITTSASLAENAVPADISAEIVKLTAELNHLNVNGYPVNLGEFKEDILAIKNGVHDLKLYYAPPVADESHEDSSTTVYKIGEFNFPLKTVQEIFEFDKALKNDLHRNADNQEVAKFFMSIVSIKYSSFAFHL